MTCSLSTRWRPLNEGLPRKGRRGRPRSSADMLTFPQRRPPHEGEARPVLQHRWHNRCRPQRRPPHEGEASPSRVPRCSARAALNEGLPRKGRREGLLLEEACVVEPSTKASPGRGGEPAPHMSTSAARNPQRRPPQEGEARMVPVVGSCQGMVPQRRPPQEGEASDRRGAAGAGDAALNEGLPRKGRREDGPEGVRVRRGPSTKASPGRGGEGRSPGG